MLKQFVVYVEIYQYFLYEHACQIHQGHSFPLYMAKRKDSRADI